MSPVNNHVPIQHLRGAAAAWASNNPTLADGERGVERDTGLEKIGDGATAWTSLNHTTDVVPPWGIVQKLFDRSVERVSAYDNLSSTERTDVTGYTGSIDVTAKINSIATYLAGKKGGIISVPPGKMQVNGLVLPGGVSLVAENFGHSNGQPVAASAAHQIVSTASGWTIDTSSSQTYSQVVAGLYFGGPGSGTSCGGIRHQLTSYAGVVGCFFTNYSEWAILQLGGVASLFQDNVAYNCLLDRLRTIDQTTLPHGVIELRGTDNYVTRGEYTTSQSGVFGASAVTGTCQAGSTASTTVLASGASATNSFYNGYLVEITGGLGAGQINYCTAYNGSTKTMTMLTTWWQTPDNTSTYSLTPMRCFAGAFKGVDSWVTDGMYEISEGGIFIANGSSPHRFNGTIADQNSGPGWLITGGSLIGSTCYGSRSSKAVDGAYDDMLIIGAGSGSSIDGAMVGGLASDTNQPRHGYHHALSPTGADSARCLIRVGSRVGARRGKLLKVEQNGQFAKAACVSLPGGVLILTTGTTPSIDGWKRIHLNYASATTITQFQDLAEGETYVITAQNANVTLANGASIVLKSGANTVMSATLPLIFTSFNGVLYQA